MSLLGGTLPDFRTTPYCEEYVGGLTLHGTNRYVRIDSCTEKGSTLLCLTLLDLVKKPVKWIVAIGHDVVAIVVFVIVMGAVLGTCNFLDRLGFFEFALGIGETAAYVGACGFFVILVVVAILVARLLSADVPSSPQSAQGEVPERSAGGGGDRMPRSTKRT